MDNTIMAQSPLSFYSPCQFPVASVPILFYLLGNPPWRDRIPSTLAPGYSGREEFRAARKVWSDFETLPI